MRIWSHKQAWCVHAISNWRRDEIGNRPVGSNQLSFIFLRGWGSFLSGRSAAVSVCRRDLKLNEYCCRCPLPFRAGGERQGDHGKPVLLAVMGKWIVWGGSVQPHLCFDSSISLFLLFLHFVGRRPATFVQLHLRARARPRPFDLEMPPQTGNACALNFDRNSIAGHNWLTFGQICSHL